MSQQILNDGDTFGVQRGKINQNFTSLFTTQLTSADVLTRNNTNPYSPVNPYNPCTKGYADQLITALKAIFDPNNVSNDAYNRANHYGNISASYVIQDTNNRFASDVEKALWSAKEPAIGAKGTAFNKNFGTTSGTVATGDHSHTGEYEPANTNIQNHISSTANPHETTAEQVNAPNLTEYNSHKNNTSNPHSVTAAQVGAPSTTDFNTHVDNVSNPHGVTKDQIGLGNVDNTADLAKPAIAFVPQGSIPSYQEGKMYYNSNDKTVNIMTEFSDVTLNIGQEMYAKVINNTGGVILNGQACKFVGSDPITNIPLVELAKADSFANGFVVGVATMEIGIGEQGYVSCYGLVRDVDTSSFSIGLVYLSDTVAGELTQTTPPITTVVGAVLKVGTTDGIIGIKISNHVSLPSLFGSLNSIASTYNLTTSPQNLIGYTTEDEVFLPVDKTTGKIDLPIAGRYRVTFNATMNVPSLTSTRKIECRLWDSVNLIEITSAHITIPRDSTTISGSFSLPFKTDVPLTGLVMQILADTSISGVTFEHVTFDIESIYLR